MEEFEKIILELNLKNIGDYLRKYGYITDKNIAIKAIVINPVAYLILDKNLLLDPEVAIYWYPEKIIVDLDTKLSYWSIASIEPINAFIKVLSINNYTMVANVQTLFNQELENNSFRLNYQRLLTELIKDSKTSKEGTKVIYTINRKQIIPLVDNAQNVNKKVL